MTTEKITADSTNTTITPFDKDLPKGKSINFRGYDWVDQAADLIEKIENSKNPIAKVTHMDIVREIYANGITPFMISRGYPPTEEGWENYKKAYYGKAKKLVLAEIAEDRKAKE